MLWAESEGAAAASANRLICNQLELLTLLYWKSAAINNTRTFYLPTALTQLPHHHSHNYGNRQKLITVTTQYKTLSKVPSCITSQLYLPHFLFLDNNGDELAEHWSPPKDTSCKRLTDPLAISTYLWNPDFLQCLLIWFFREFGSSALFSHWLLKDTRCKSRLTLLLPVERQKV